MNRPLETHFIRWINVNLRFTSACLNRSFSCVFLAECCKRVRICFDSHSLWIPKQISDFQNDFCVRVYALDRTVQYASDSLGSGFRDDMRRDLDEVRMLPWFLFGDSNRFFDSWPWIFVGKLASIFSSSLLIRILWNPSPLLLLLLLNLLAVIVLSSSLLVMNSVLELQRARLNDEDSSLNLWELTLIPWL